MKKLNLGLLVLAFLVIGSQGKVYDDSPFLYEKFPNDFIWAAASASYQVEGAWNEDGKGENIWDTFCRKPGAIRDGTNGNVACDSYHKWRDDIQILKDIKANGYRFSISWTRLFPNGTGSKPLAAGVKYYNEIINELLANKIKPLVTLYHWDLPQALEDKGGWLNEDAVIEPFAKFARTCYELFGDRVKYWVTFNEPWVIAYLGYETGSKAPGLKGQGNHSYIAGHALLKAHARAWHIYDDEFRSKQKGQIGITYNTAWSEPINWNSTGDLEAMRRGMAWDLDWLAEPIFGGKGDYPAVMKERIYNNSMAQGFNKSRLPEFTEAEKRYINNTSDFFGLNFYSAALVQAPPRPRDISTPSVDGDKDIDGGPSGGRDPDWPRSGSSWLHVTPWSMRRILNWIKQKYNNPPVFITENGVSDRNGTLDDQHRVNYIKDYTNFMLKGMKFDNCTVIGYTAWTLMDNFEWECGYTEMFGIHYVNFSDPNLTRVQKASAKYFRQLIVDNGFVDPKKNKNNASTTQLSLVLSVVSAAFYLVK